MSELRTLDEIERQVIEERLAHFGGHQKSTAESLDIGYRTLYDKLKRYKAIDRMKQIVGECGP